MVSVDKKNKKASIDHEEIPGFMEPMTMDFRFKDDWVWDVLEPGAEVRVRVTRAAPHHLVADEFLGVSQRRPVVAAACGTGSAGLGAAVNLGMPSLP